MQLETTFAGLTGAAVGCVKFFGITSFTSVATEYEVTMDPNLPQHRIRLVFERATSGSLFDHISKVIIKASYLQSWEMLVTLMASAANGLWSLHKHRVLHR